MVVAVVRIFGPENVSFPVDDDAPGATGTYSYLKEMRTDGVEQERGHDER
jgi:hypothetical protein